MRGDLPTGTVTFLFTDVEGSTRLLRSVSGEQYAELLADHRRVLRAAFEAHGGVEVDTQGDAFFVAFPTAEAACAAARAAHAGLAGGLMSVRVGVHTGAPLVSGDGYVGEEVHRAARVAALAHGGQTVLSEVTAALLDGADLIDLGDHRLKDFDGATRLFQLGRQGFPPLRSPYSVRLPAPATGFIGRERELLDAAGIFLDRAPRLLTITGPGGTGKTRFAIELAAFLADEAAGGTSFAPLAPLRDAALVESSVAAALGADGAGIGAVVAGRPTHLVLDNLEHLLPAAAPPLAALLASVPTLRVIGTSREPVRIAGEHEFDLPPLHGDEAVRLFVTRAQAVRADIAPGPEVEELCTRLDRLPLALELAAARTKLLSPAALLDRLGARLDLLRGARDADPRHATLRATIAWSHDLLDDRERRLFARLSVFAAGCTLESAEAVCDADVLDLESLLDKSLLRRRSGRLGEDRYWMLETIREYAAEQLAEAGEADAIERRRLARMAHIAAAARLSDESQLGQERARPELVVAEQDDMRAALDWASGHDTEAGLRLAVALEHFWPASDPAEGYHRITALLESADRIDDRLRATALRIQGGNRFLCGDIEGARSSFDQSLALYEQLGDEAGIAGLLIRMCQPFAPDAAAARAMIDRAVILGRRSGMFAIDALAEGSRATLLAREGDPEGALALYERSADSAAEVGFGWWEASTRCNVCQIALELGRHGDAERAARAAVEVARTIDDRMSTIWSLTGLARVALVRREHERAGRLWGAVLDEDERSPITAGQPEFPDYSSELVRECNPRFLAGVEQGRHEGLWAAADAVIAEGPS
jgi:predicted ATPase